MLKLVDDKGVFLLIWVLSETKSYTRYGRNEIPMDPTQKRQAGYVTRQSDEEKLLIAHEIIIFIIS